MFDNKKILVASTNPGKIAELRAMLGGEVEWVGLSDFSDIAEIEEDGAVVSGVSPLDSEDDMLYETVSVSVEELMFAVNLDEYFKAVQRTVQSDFVWFDEELVEDVMIGDTRAKRTIFTFEDQGETVVTLGYCFVKGNKAYLITCISDDYSYDSYAADFESSAQSFRFE